MHFLIFTVGSHGDLNPYLGIGKEIQCRGHRVTLMTNARFQSLIESRGLGFVPVGVDDCVDRYVDDTDFFEPTRSWKLALEACYLGPMRSTFEAIRERFVTGETVVVSASWGFGARIAHESLGVPLVTIHLEPHNIRSMYDTGLMPPPMILNDWIPRWLKRLQFWVADHFFIDPRIAPRVNEFRNELGLKPVNRLLCDWWNSPQLILGLYPRWLVPPQPDWPKQIEITGFPLWDRSDATDAETEELIDFVRRGERPLIFTAGSNNVDAGDFFSTAVECCIQLGRRGILVAKDGRHVPANLPDDVQQLDYVPFSSVLPHAAAFIHHGGAGSIAQALAAGVPQLVMPRVHGTPEFASRVTRLGVAETIKPSQFRTKRVAKAIERLVKSERVADRCQLFREKMAGDEGFRRTCDAIERFALTTQRTRIEAA